GNYSDYSRKKKALRDAELKAYLNQQTEIQRQEQVIEKLKSFNREKSIKRAESREKLLSKVDRLDKPSVIDDAMKLKITPSVISGRDVLTLSGLSKAYPGTPLFNDISLDIRRGEHVAVIGNNGAGKTTLLKIIMGLVEADSGSFQMGVNVKPGYYDQEHQVLHAEKTLFQEISDSFPELDNTRIRNTLAAFLFYGDDVFKQVSALSGGERGRLSLAKLMLGNANFLILDEPTNHLDITSKEILENALNEYEGTVLYVSHDRYFINSTASRILDLTDGEFVNYNGNYDYYLEKRAERSSNGSYNVSEASGSLVSDGRASGSTSRNVSSSGGSSSDGSSSNASSIGSTSGGSSLGSKGIGGDGKLSWQEQKALEAEKRKKQNRLKKVEEEIEAYESRKNDIDLEMSDPEVATDVKKLTELSGEAGELDHKLSALYEEWEVLQTE
nr:ATP-binding cassette domain-containing protein [Lachnospiraceae bacterium]